MMEPLRRPWLQILTLRLLASDSETKLLNTHSFVARFVKEGLKNIADDKFIFRN